MRLNVIDADFLPDWVKEKLLEQQKNKINNNFELVVQSQRHRTQLSNIDDALAGESKPDSRSLLFLVLARTPLSLKSRRGW